MGYDPYLSPKAAWSLNPSIKQATSYDEIFKSCDYISLHVPLTANTKNLINAESIAKMKNGVRILNFARAALVDDEALKAALESGKVASYVTDFPTDEVLGVDGVIAIPHLGASTPESEDNCAVMAAKELIDYIENGNIVNSVNLPEITMPRSGEHRICVIHKNIPNMLTAITKIVADDNVNIENLLNKSRGDYAYTMLDIGTADTDMVANEIAGIEGVIKVRVI
jgi:D-3-phosphoglycerate dehydrogenase